jgi:hypothetical protein
MHSRALRLLITLLAFTITASWPALAQQRPLITEEVEIIKPGAIRIEFGFDFLQDKDFTLSGLNGDLTRVGVVMLRTGLAPNVELQSGGVLQNYLSINRQFQPSAIPLKLTSAPNSTHGTGDFFMAVKVKLRAEGARTPALGFRFGVELPNSNQERGIGLNQMNFFTTALAAKRIGRFHLVGNLGLGILTAPVDPFAQNDVLLYGLAASYLVNDRLTLVGEVNGRHSTRRNAPRGTESDGEARLGARIRAAGFTWDVAGITGLTRRSARSGITFGVTYQADVFTPVK